MDFDRFVHPLPAFRRADFLWGSVFSASRAPIQLISLSTFASDRPAPWLMKRLIIECASKQALDSESVRSGLKDVLLGPARLYESLREEAAEDIAG